MPQIGDLCKGKDIDLADNDTHIWQSCSMCRKERWVRLRKGIPISLNCKPCGFKKPRPSRKGLFSGNKNPRWRGGIYYHSGYKAISLSVDNFFYPMVNKTGYVYEHRLVMAKHLGRCLQAWEIVHHKNGIKLDNRLENLILTLNQYHEKHTVQHLLQERIRQLEARVTLLEAELILNKHLEED